MIIFLQLQSITCKVWQFCFFRHRVSSVASRGDVRDKPVGDPEGVCAESMWFSEWRRGHGSWWEMMGAWRGGGCRSKSRGRGAALPMPAMSKQYQVCCCQCMCFAHPGSIALSGSSWAQFWSSWHGNAPRAQNLQDWGDDSGTPSKLAPGAGAPLNHP